MYLIESEPSPPATVSFVVRSVASNWNISFEPPPVMLSPRSEAEPVIVLTPAPPSTTSLPLVSSLASRVNALVAVVIAVASTVSVAPSAIFNSSRAIVPVARLLAIVIFSNAVMEVIDALSMPVPSAVTSSSSAVPVPPVNVCTSSSTIVSVVATVSTPV